MFKTEATRRKDSQVASTSSFKEFIESLQLQVQTTLMSEEQRARVLQVLWGRLTLPLPSAYPTP